MTAVFSSVLYLQTSNQECVLQRATFATVRCMRRRWILSLSWKPLYRRLLSAKACSSNLATSLHRAVRITNITTQVLNSPEETNSLRSSWLTGDFNHIENRKQGLTPTMLPVTPTMLPLTPMEFTELEHLSSECPGRLLGRYSFRRRGRFAFGHCG